MHPKLSTLRSRAATIIQKHSLECLAVCYFLLTGFLFTFLIPPFQKPDEYVHFTKAVVLSMGQINCDANSDTKIPKHLQEFSNRIASKQMEFSPGLKFDYREYFVSPLAERGGNESVKLEARSACNLPWIGYIPQAIGVFFARLLGLGPILTFYLGRGVMFLTASVVLLTLLLKSDRKLHPIILFFFCIPMVTHQITSYSYDAALILSAISLFSLILTQANSKLVSWKMITLIVAIEILVLLSKVSGYELFIFLPLLLKPSILGKTRRDIALKYTTLFLVPILVLSLFRSAQIGNAITSQGADFVNPTLQLRYLVENPTQIVPIIANTQTENFGYYLQTMIGTFGWLEYQPAYWIQAIFLIGFGMLVLSVFYPHKNLSKYSIPLLLVLVVGTYGIFMLALYLSFTPVASSGVAGFQGRYLLPLIPLLWLLLSLVLQKPRVKIGMFILLGICLIISLSQTVFNRYYNYRQSYNDAIAQVTIPISPSAGTPSEVNSYEFSTLQDKKMIGFRIFFTSSADASNKPVTYKPLQYTLSNTCTSKPLQKNWISASTIVQSKVDVRLTSVFDEPYGCLIISNDDMLNFTIVPLYAV